MAIWRTQRLFFSRDITAKYMENSPLLRIVEKFCPSSLLGIQRRFGQSTWTYTVVLFPPDQFWRDKKSRTKKLACAYRKLSRIRQERVALEICLRGREVFLLIR